MRRSSRVAGLRTLVAPPARAESALSPKAPLPRPAVRRSGRRCSTAQEGPAPAAVPAKRRRSPPPNLSCAAGRSFEAKWWAQGLDRVAGVDEAGRGPLAGPVVAAACIIPADVVIAGVKDSKLLDHSQREAVYLELVSHPRVEWAVSVQDHTVVDSINILQATLRAMECAVAGLPRAPDRVLIDGNTMPPALAHNGETIVGGDAKSFAIGAASVLAKVTRDRLMVQLHESWPVYNFAKHKVCVCRAYSPLCSLTTHSLKGYGTPEHLALIHQHGPCPIHRRTFAPVKHMV